MKKNFLYIGLIVIGLTLLLRQVESIPHGIIGLGLGIGIGLENCRCLSDQKRSNDLAYMC